MKAAIFDFDGVLVDSETYWKAAEKRLFDRIVPGWKAGDEQKLMGRPVASIHGLLVDEYDFTMPFDEFMSVFAAMAKEVYAQAAVVPGIPELLRSFKNASLPCAIASSAKRIWIDQTLMLHGLQSFFKAIVSADDMPLGQGKPLPLPYLLAAEKLGLQPGECVAIEDAYNGVASAKAAGMKCLGYRWPGNVQDLSEADEVTEDMGTVTLELLRQL